MSNTRQRQWISLKDSRPGKNRFPVWYSDERSATVWRSEYLGEAQATHWMRADAPPVPPCKPPEGKPHRKSADGPYVETDFIRALELKLRRYEEALKEIASKADGDRGNAIELQEIATAALNADTTPSTTAKP